MYLFFSCNLLNSSMIFLSISRKSPVSTGNWTSESLFNTRRLLMLFGIGASVCTLGAICIEGMWGLYSLVAISLFMSIMFPTIYGIALENVDSKDTHLGAAFLVMAIVGGALMPPLQGMLIDQGTIWGMPAVNMSFILPLVCFLIIIVYGYRSFMQLKSTK